MTGPPAHDQKLCRYHLPYRLTDYHRVWPNSPGSRKVRLQRATLVHAAGRCCCSQLAKLFREVTPLGAGCRLPAVGGVLTFFCSILHTCGTLFDVIHCLPAWNMANGAIPGVFGIHFLPVMYFPVVGVGKCSSHSVTDQFSIDMSINLTLQNPIL